ncbi:MAG TPA: nucleotidyltransferase family protein [Opitutaceae bacterium]
MTADRSPSTGPDRGGDAADQSSAVHGRPSTVDGNLRVGVVLLAAGGSLRMGRPKQLLPLEGRPLLVRAAEAALASPAWPVVVVLGAQADAIRPALARLPVLIAENPAWAEGMASSLRAGLGVLDAFSTHIDAAIFALCDQPAFSADTIRRLIAAQQATGRSMVAARYGGHLGAPALFLRSHFHALTTLTGDQGARQLLVTAAPDAVAAVDLPELAVDLDTPADWAAWNADRT